MGHNLWAIFLIKYTEESADLNAQLVFYFDGFARIYTSCIDQNFDFYQIFNF